MKAVADASVLIDMHWAGAWVGFFRLQYSWMTPDLVASEVRSFEIQDVVKRHGLMIVSLSETQMSKLPAMMDAYRGPGFRDLAALCLARDVGACLATCDSRLREAAEAEGVVCFGSLRLLKDMVNGHFVTPARAMTGLLNMLANGSRLPRTECAELFASWARLGSANDA